jgi:ABC-2 type transport system ATP-binding protein
MVATAPRESVSRASPEAAGPRDDTQSLRVDCLTKVYGRDFRANDAITLRVDPGEVYGLLGPNGAGKTTLVKQVIGLLKPTGGTIRLGQYDLVADPGIARQLCSYLPQAQMPIASLRAREAIELTGLIRGGDGPTVRRRADALIDALELGDWRQTLGVRLSGGIRRLVGFAMVTVWPGRVVILDEPTNDVDPLRRRLLWNLVRRLGDDGAAVLLVTHNVLEAEKAVDRLAVIDHGRLLAEGTPSSMKTEDRDRLRLSVMLRPDAETPPMPPFVCRHARSGHHLTCEIEEADAATSIAWAQHLMSDDVAEEYALGATTLEDVYIRLTGAAALDEPAT